MAGRPRKLKIYAVRFIGHRDSQSETFTSRREALAYCAGAKRTTRVDEVYFAARGWELEVEDYPLEGELLRDESDYSGKRFVEREFTLKGADPVALEKAAETRRMASFMRHWTYLADPRNRAPLPPASREFAKEVVEVYYQTVADPQVERLEETKAAKAAEEKRRAHEESIPSVGQAFEANLSRRLKSKTLQSNTAVTYRYEATAFDVEVPVGGQMVALRDVKVTKLTSKMIRGWFDVFAATETKFGKLPTGKTLENTLGHLTAVRKELKRDDELSDYAKPFAVLEDLLGEARKARDSDGWRRRLRLSNEEVVLVLDACNTDLERCAIALALGGGRPPSELVAAEWPHLDYDAEGNLWWHVQASGIEHAGEIELREHTKTRQVDYRQLSICKGLAGWIEARRGISNFVLGSGEGESMLPSDLIDLIEAVLERARVKKTGISTYSFRHTVSDEVERILGRTARDLVLHGKRDRTTGGLHYSHAERDRRRKELTVDGKPFGEHMVWASYGA